jgi:hypothetical protein
MGYAMELVAGFTTAPGATITAVTLAAGNSLTVRNARLDSRAWLLSLWTDHQVAGIVHLRSAKLHDNVQGIRARTMISEVQPVLPRRFRQPLVPQDTLILAQSGSAVAGDIESACFLAFYEDLPGTDGQFIDAGTLAEKTIEIVTVETSHTTAATGGYSGEVALNSSFDLLKANEYYALIGYDVSAECAAVRIRGADTGNLGVGGPGSDTDRHLTRDWFRGLAADFDMPLIPVFNSANKGGILCDAVQDENAAAVVVNWIFARLGNYNPGGGARR